MGDSKRWENVKGNVEGEKWFRQKNTAVVYKIPPAACQMRESPHENPSA